MAATSSAGAELLKRLNNKLGGYGPLPGARPPSSSSSSSSATFGADTFRALGAWERELCDPDRGVLAHLADPASPAFFQNLHRASQERILVALLRVARPREVAPATLALVEKFVAVGGDKMCWAPRLAGVVREKFGLPDPGGGGAGPGPSLLDQEADKVCALLDPVGAAPFCYAAPGGDAAGGDSSGTANANAPDMPGRIEDRVVRGMARLGVLRNFPYSTVLAGTGKGDRVLASAYGALVPDSAKVLMSAEAQLPEEDYPFTLKHAVAFSGASVGVGGAGQSSRSALAAAGKQNDSMSSSSSSSSSSAGGGGASAAAAGHSHFKDAQHKKNQAIANQTDAMLEKLSSATGNPSKKRARDDGGAAAAAPPMPAAAAASGAPPPVPAMPPAGWDDMNSEHLKRFSDLVAIIDRPGGNVARKQKLKQKHKFRLQDFAAFPNHTMGADKDKDHFAIPFQINKQEDGQKRLVALVLYYTGSRAGTFTEKSSNYKKRKRGPT